MLYNRNYPAFRFALNWVFSVGIVSPFGYNVYVRYEVVQSERFRRWLNRLRDHRARSRITGCIRRVGDGNFGNHSSVGGGVSELRVDVGQGYRIYYTIRQQRVVILLCGGEKASQQRDIRLAQQMAREV